MRAAFVSSFLVVPALLVGCSGDGWTRNNGVIGTGNAGRIQVSVRPDQQDGRRQGWVYLLQSTDSLPRQIDSCALSLDQTCRFAPGHAGTYRAELWVAGRMTGRTGWFELGAADKVFPLDLSSPRPFKFRLSTGATADTVVLGTRRRRALWADSGWNTEGLRDSGEVLWVHRAGTGWTGIQVRFANGLPDCSGASNCVASAPVLLTPDVTAWADATVIGIPNATGSPYDNDVYGTDSLAGLGAAWDGRTVGRTLVRVVLPSSLSGKTIRSARLVYQTHGWGLRPTGGRTYTLESHRMLRAWKEGAGMGGVSNSATVDGATSQEASFGNPWTRPLVGLDGTDAEAAATGTDSLPYLSLQSFGLDLRAAVQAWVSNPSTNFGMVFRDVHEGDGLYLDYPDFWMKEAGEPLNRPRLIIETAP